MLAAQAPYVLPPQRPAPFGQHGGVHALLPGDFDGDGRIDLVIASSSGVTLYDHGGATRLLFAAPLLTPPISALAADVDLDGDLDLLCWRRNGAEWLVNDGHAKFTASAKGLSPSIAIVDAVCTQLTGDARPELATIEGGRLHLYTQNQGGKYGEATPAGLPSTGLSRVLASDFDGDLDTDLLVTGTAGTWWLRNDGTGWTVLHVGSMNGVSALVADLRGNGRPACLLGTPTFKLIALELGSGGWTSRVLLRSSSPGIAPVAATDFDGDGHTDLLVGGAPDGTGTRLFRNDGSGNLFAVPSSVTNLPFDRFSTTALAAVCDWDGDGDLDLIYAPSGPGTAASAIPRLFLREGASFEESTGEPTPQIEPRHLGLGRSGPALSSVADLDRDGRPDLLHRDGTVHFQTPKGFGPLYNVVPGPRDAARIVVALDLDEDGNADLVSIASSATGEIATTLRNEGGGVFRVHGSVALPLGSLDLACVLIGDLDLDGHLDLVLVALSGAHVVLRGDGRGRLAVAPGIIPRVVESTLGATLVDLDHDGDLDLVLANQSVTGGARSRVLLNHHGVFVDVTATALPALPGPEFSASVVAADFDRDGNVDLAFFGPTLNSLVSSRWLRGSAVGTFTFVSTLPVGTGFVSAGLAADLDHDGAVDLLAADQSANGLLVLANRRGAFVPDATLVQLPYGTVSPAALVDVDGDGDDDLVLDVLSNGSGALVLPGRTRQIGSAETPRIGAIWNLLVEAEPGYAMVPKLAVPVFGARSAQIALPPLGTLRVDPLGSVVLAPLVIGVPTGAATLGVTIPTNAGLVGAPFTTQTLIVDLVAGAHFSNALVERIR